MSGYGNPPKEHQWKKGQSGNPSGPGKHVIARKVLKKYTQDAIVQAFNKLLYSTTPELAKIIKDADSPIIEVIVAQALLKDMRRSRMDLVEKLLDRIIGKAQAVKNEIVGELTPPKVIFSRAAPQPN